MQKICRFFTVVELIFSFPINNNRHLSQLLVKEDWIARAILHLVELERIVVEGAGACPLAAILGNLVPELKTKKYVLYILKK